MKNLGYSPRPIDLICYLTIYAYLFKTFLTSYLILFKMLCEIVKYLELKASIEANTMTIF